MLPCKKRNDQARFLEIDSAQNDSFCFGDQASGFRLQASGFRLQASGFRLQASGFRLQASTGNVKVYDKVL
jgi:hypothetical protein